MLKGQSREMRVAEDLKPVKSAARVLDMLELLARADNSLTFSEIAAALDLPKSSTHALLQTLVQRRYIEPPASGRAYRLGIKILELSAAYERDTDLIEQFHRVASQLVAACGETVQLAMLDGTEVLYLAKEEGTRPVRLVSHVGARLPAYAASLGKVLLAQLSDDQLRERFAGVTMKPLTPRTMTSFAQLQTAVNDVRLRGYAIDEEEVVTDLCCFAAPIRDASGQTIAAISMSVPKNRSGGNEQALVCHITEAAADLSERLEVLGVHSPAR